jgi:hypothetical protein
VKNCIFLRLILRLNNSYNAITYVLSFSYALFKNIKICGILLALVEVKVVLIFSRGGGYVPDFAGRGELGFC